MKGQMKTEIIYEDRDIIVVRKPAGLATQTAKAGQQDVASELKNYLRQPYLGVIHRLDQPVEGLLVFGKNSRAAAGLTAQLQRQGEGGTLNKRYYAVLCGKPAEKEGRFVDCLCKAEGNRAVIVGSAGVSEEAAAQKGAKRAILSYRILQILDSPAELTLAEICLETGRFHQIRAQMAHHGYPLLGDGKYGDERVKSLSQGLGEKNVALCACYLEFVHPVTGENMNFRIEPRGQAFSFFRFVES